VVEQLGQSSCGPLTTEVCGEAIPPFAAAVAKSNGHKSSKSDAERLALREVRRVRRSHWCGRCGCGHQRCQASRFECHVLRCSFCSLDLPPARFDVALALEIFSHVPDQRGFVRQLAAVLKPRGHLILLTQNRLIYSRRSDIAPQGVGHVRCWVTMRQLRALVAPHFDVLRVYHGAERSSGLFAHGEFRQAQCSSVSGDTSPQDRLVKGTGWTRANAGHAGTAAP